jgi:hypothetical protein
MIWGAEHGRVLVYATIGGIYRIVGDGATPTLLTPGGNEYNHRYFPTQSGRVAGVGQNPATVTFRLSGGDSGSILSGSDGPSSVAGPTGSGIMRKRDSGWQIEDAYSVGNGTALGVAPSPSGTYSGLFYANGRVTLLTTSQVAYTDNSGATWTTVSHSASPPASGAPIYGTNREVCQASLANGASSILIVGKAASYTVSVDNGQTWTNYATPGGITIYDICSGGGEIAMLGPSGTIYVTKDGINWAQRYAPANTYRIFIEDFGPAAFKLSRVYALTNKGIFVSTAT